MSDRNRVTLSKACDQCIQAKRKCSRSLPRCQRCEKRKIPCRYKNAPLDGKIFPPGAVFLVATRRYEPIEDGENPMNSPFFRGLARTIKNSYSPHSSLPRLSPRQMGQPDIILAMDKSSVIYLADHLRSFPSILIQTGGAPFIHPQLYRDGLPPALQNIVALCNLYTRSNASDYHTLSEDISNAAQTLLNFRPTLHTFKSKLAFVQSLILLQIITLFSSPSLITPILRQQAENRIQLLRALVQDLYRSTPATLPPSIPPYQAWVLAESCRRTIHVAHLLHGVYLMLTRGYLHLTIFVKALPLCRNSGLWEHDPSAYDEQLNGAADESGSTRALESELISYRELTDMWDNDEVKHLHLFEEMLIAACKGIESVKARLLKFHTPPANVEEW